MTLTLDLSPELEERLAQEATRNGIAPPEYVRRLLEDCVPGTQSHPPTAEERAARVAAARGKYAHLKTSSEAFALRKQEEIDLEDRRWKERSR